MPVQRYAKRAVRELTRACDAPRLMCNATSSAAVVTALPEQLDETAANYTALATLEEGAAPIALNTDVWVYRPAPDAKMCALEFASVAGADNNTQVWELGLYAFPSYLNRIGNPTTYNKWKLLGTVIFTITLGTRTLAGQTVDPWAGTASFSSSTIRWGDTYTESHNDFANSTAGFYQVFSLGYGAANKSGLVVVDMSFATLLALKLTTKSASGTNEIVGVTDEIN